MAITGQVHTPLRFGEAKVADWQVAGFTKMLVFKPVLTTIKQGLVLRVLGYFSAGAIKTPRGIVADVVG